MLERYSESDEMLIGLPPEKAGENVNQPEEPIEKDL
jgi:hypothetical protein